jgi:hypothetical protein
MSRFIALLFSLFVLVGCADPNAPYVFQIEDSFTDEEVDVLYHAAEEWNQHTTRKIVFGPNDKRHVIKRDRDHFPGEIDRTTLAPGQQPYAIGDNTLVVIGRGFVTKAIVMHEFGHAHGLKHTNAPGVMGYGGDELSEHDLYECRRVKACE